MGQQNWKHTQQQAVDFPSTCFLSWQSPFTGDVLFLGKCQGSFFIISSEIIKFLSSVGTHIPQDCCALPSPTGVVNELGRQRENGMEGVSVFGWNRGRCWTGGSDLTQEWPSSAGAEWIITHGILNCLWISHSAPAQREKSILFFCFVLFVSKIRLWRLEVLLLLV